MTIPTIDSLTFTQLTELKTQIDTRIAAMRDEGAPQLFDDFTRKAAELGLSLEDVCGNGKRNKRYRRRRRSFSFFRKRPHADPPTSEPIAAPAIGDPLLAAQR